MPDSRPKKNLFAHAPVFLVSDLVASVAWYRDVLGFSDPPLWGEPPCFAMPQRDGLIVMLQLAAAAAVQPNSRRRDDAEAWDAFFWCADSEPLWQAFRAAGVDVVYPPVDRPCYGMREFAVRDPDGYVLCFGHHIEAPAAGESAT